jgi:ribulose-phosphate 3-epimerase
MFHFDEGVGQFVPPVTLGPMVLQWISPIVHRAGGRLDCHLMVDQPEKHFEAIAKAGGDSVTFHYEVADDVGALAAEARGHGFGVGLAFNPQTEPEQAAEVADPVDLVLCMSINPGYSGQAFMPEAIGRIERLRAVLPAEKHVQVDGGVGRQNVPRLREAGADLFVAGTSVFGADDIAQAYRELVGLL